MKSMSRPKGCVASIAVGIERSLLRVFPNVSVTVYPTPWLMAFKIHVQVRTLNGRHAEYTITVNEYAVQDTEVHEHVIQDAVWAVVQFVIQSNPRNFL